MGKTKKSKREDKGSQQRQWEKKAALEAEAEGKRIEAAAASFLLADQRPSPRRGTLHLHETALCIWDECEVGNPDEQAMRLVYYSILEHLRQRGFEILRDPHVEEQFPTLSPWRHYVRKGSLEAILETSGRFSKVEFFQSVVRPPDCNPNGAQYDFNKYRLLPRFLRLEFLVEQASLIRFLAERFGYPLIAAHGQCGYRDGQAKPIDLNGSRSIPLVIRDLLREPNWAEDPLGAFNAGWGEGRFTRGTDGWPIPSECCCHTPGQCLDRDGRELLPGETRYMRLDDGRLRRGKVYPGMNSSWVFVYRDGREKVFRLKELFSCDRPDLEPRKVSPDREKRLSALLDAAIKAQNFEQAIILRDLLGKAPTPVPKRTAMPIVRFAGGDLQASP